MALRRSELFWRSLSISLLCGDLVLLVMCCSSFSMMQLAYAAAVASSRRSTTALITLAALLGMHSLVCLGPEGTTNEGRMVASDMLELCCWLRGTVVLIFEVVVGVGGILYCAWAGFYSILELYEQGWLGIIV